MQQKHILFLFNTVGFADARGQETMDALLVAAAFDQKISVLVTGSAVWQLLTDQHGAAVDAKSLAKSFAALPMYDIEDVFVDAETLQAHAVSTSELSVPVIVLDREQQTDLISRQDIVFSGS